MLKLKFRTKLLLNIAGASLICTALAVFMGSRQLVEEGTKGQISKAEAILTRTEVARNYVASMNTLGGIVENAVINYPNGVLPDEERERIIKSVPVYAAMKVGAEGAEKDHYKINSEFLQKMQGNPLIKRTPKN